MADDPQELSKVANPNAGGQSRRHRIPRPVVYTITILFLILLIVILFPKGCSGGRDLEILLQQSLVEVQGNQGDVLEVSTLATVEIFSEKDKLDSTIIGIPWTVWKTEASLTVPVTYRFHVLLSDKWRIRETEETITVIAPDIRPSYPPAPDVSKMIVQSTRTGLPIPRVKDAAEERLKKMLTGELNLRAREKAYSQLIRDASRGSVENFLVKYVRWLPAECKDKVFVIKFGNEDTKE